MATSGAGTCWWMNGRGPCLIDPAVYGGHREMDLAMMQLFGGFSERAFAAYAEAFPLSSGHAQRRSVVPAVPAARAPEFVRRRLLERDRAGASRVRLDPLLAVFGEPHGKRRSEVFRATAETGPRGDAVGLLKSVMPKPPAERAADQASTPALQRPRNRSRARHRCGHGASSPK